MIAIVQQKFERLSLEMDEKLKRHWAACEALAIGRGGISAVSKATGMSRNTIRKGIAEVENEMPQLASELAQRVRRPGGGRRRLSERDPKLARDLTKLLEAGTRGDPRSPLQWTCKSTRKLAHELKQRGHQVSHMTVDRMLHDMGFSLQGNRKAEEGRQHPDRDAQFQYIAKRVRSFHRRGQPVISVDAKKREIVGKFKNPGREWRPKHDPQKVDVHDFAEEVAIPYGCYDPGRNEGWVSVGVDRNTAEFAVSTIGHWWQRMGRDAYPKATQLLITADAGGSNGYRIRLWKACLQEFADESGLRIAVCHFPPGTSKWNAIDHKMFCHITQNWRARPLLSHAIVVNLIGKAATRQGLRIQAKLDRRRYEKGLKVSDDEFAALNIKADRFHGEWNYLIVPRT
jgi:transposase